MTELVGAEQDKRVGVWVNPVTSALPPEWQAQWGRRLAHRAHCAGADLKHPSAQGSGMPEGIGATVVHLTELSPSELFFLCCFGVP